tara:strand:- start:332 stop:1153 length:822 start_codon:yes stop_codon:yes gene_type:complete
MFGGGGGGSTSGTQVSIAREAPEVESRKLALYDEAARLAERPVGIPAFQVAGPSPLESLGFRQAGTTGVGAATTGAGIGSVLQSTMGPNINQFLNPYQQYVTDEIARQGQMAQNQLSANAIGAGAFGGGREGVQRAELQRATQANIGQSLASGFNQAAGLAAQQQGLQQQAGQLLGALGGQQQAMQQADIASLMQAGGVQRQLGQAALEAQRQTDLARTYEPYQRIEFLKNIMTNLPTTQSAVTATTAPGTNPLAQAAGAGIGAYAAYNLGRR